MYWLVTAWSNKVSEARLIDWGICAGFDELINIKTKYKIKPHCIAIDSGDDTVSIYKESVLRGEMYKNLWVTWCCLKGDGGKISPKVDYTHPDGTKHYYGTVSQPDPQWQFGSKFAKYRARLYLWSNYSIKTLLTNIIAGRSPFKFKFNHRADETFTNHMYSERLDAKSGRFEKNTQDTRNDLWDCMCMALVLALMSKCYIPEATISEAKVIEAIPKPETTALQTIDSKL
jgi:hypothetical protein